MNWSERLRDFRNKARSMVRNAGYRVVGADDGHSFPPSRLIHAVIGTREVAWYYLGGLFMHLAIATLLRNHGRPIESHHTILDFGCGCGRILRWWSALSPTHEIWGCDYNPELITWCERKLGDVARYKINRPRPPLDFEDGKFDFIYSYSVLTHVAEPDQRPWMAELHRVLKPGGLLLLTTHGLRCARRSGFSPAMLEALEEKGALAFGEDQAGTNACSIYHAERFMAEQEQALGFNRLEYLPGGVRDSSEQDIYLFEKL